MTRVILDAYRSSSTQTMDEYSRFAPGLSRATLTQRWDLLTFVHWRCDPFRVQALLPTGLSVDTFDGSAWVGLVGFRMVDVRPPVVPTLHPLTTFSETNVRTYVRGSRGPGVWFFSLEIPRLLGVTVARTLFSVPYTWAAMSIVADGPRVRYESRRRWPAPRGAHSTLEVLVTGPITAPNELEIFLTSRWATYTALGGGLGWVPVAHEPWSLSACELIEIDESLLAAAGLPDIPGAPLVHHADPVTARIGWPRTA